MGPSTGMTSIGIAQPFYKKDEEKDLMDSMNQTTSDAQYLNSFIRGMAISQMLGVICEVELPDTLHPDETCSIKSLAVKLGVDERVLLRVSRTLSAFGFFTIDVDGNIQHNSRSLMLRKGRYSSQHWAARFWTSPGVWGAWDELRHALRTGEEGFKQAHQKQFFDYMNTHTDEADTYRQYMASGYPGRHEAVASILELDDVSTVIDVGGGTGVLIRAILDKHPNVSGVVYDQSDVIRSVTATQAYTSLNGRYTLLEGDFFTSVPEGGDVYVLSYVLHDWPDFKALEILRSCRRSMSPSSRLIIVERLINDNPAACDPFDLLLDINMLVLHAGQERTLSHFNLLMKAAGFSSVRLIRGQATFSVFEVLPV